MQTKMSGDNTCPMPPRARKKMNLSQEFEGFHTEREQA